METFFAFCYNISLAGVTAVNVGFKGGFIMVYKTSGVCSSAISFDIDDSGKVHDVKFQGGCSGNTQGVASLCRGMKADEVVERLRGIRCGAKPTSCPDQLARALEEEGFTPEDK